MQSAPRLPADHFGKVLGRLQPDLDLDALALATRAVVRKRVVASGADVLRFRRDRTPGADFIVRIGRNAFSLRHPDGSAFDLIKHLHALPHDMGPHEVLVRARSGRLGEPVPRRLVTQRKTPDAAEATRKKQRQQATRQQKALKPGRRATAKYVVLATSLPADGYAAPDILAADRLR